MTQTPPLKMHKEEAVTVSAEARLTALGLTLPRPAAPVAAYVPAVEAAGLLHVSGQLPFQDGQVMTGRVGDDRTPEYAQNAARQCGIMLLAQIRQALGSLDRVERVVKLNVFVNSDARFGGQPQVANGVSELMIEVFGEAGRHARAAVGVAALPLGAVVEADAIVAVRAA